jgi:O-antigen ligase
MLSFLLALYLLLLPFGQLLRVPTPHPGIIIHLTDIIIGLLFFIWITIRMLSGISTTDSRPNVYQPTSISRPLTVFAIIALLSVLKDIFTTPLAESITATLYLFRWIAYASLFPITLRLINHQDSRFPQHLNLNKLLIITFSAIALFGWLQYFFYPDLRPLANYGWDPHYYRLTGTFLDPGFTGILILIGLIHLFFKYISQKNHFNNYPSLITYYLLFITYYLAIAFTYSRATYLALITATLIHSWFIKSWKFLFTGLAVFLITLIILPQPEGAGGNLGRTDTITYRLTNYQQSFQIIKQHPLLGTGFNRLRYAKRDAQLVTMAEWQTSHSAAGFDNSLLFVLATTGILGLTAYLWLWYEILKSIWPKTPKKTISNYLLPITFIAIFTHSQFHNTLFYPPVMALTWILISLHFADHLINISSEVDNINH